MMIAADASDAGGWNAATVTTLSLSLLALAVAAWAAWAGHRAAKAAERSADIAERSMTVSAQSAKAAEVSARAAEKSADADGQLALVELGRNHHELAPELLGAEFRAAGGGLWFTFTLSRAYRVYPYLLFKNGGNRNVAIDPNLLVPAGLKARVYVGEMDSLPPTLELRFFPPADLDPVDAWTCRCGGEVNADKDKAGHWVVRRRVEKPESFLGKEDVQI